MTEILTKTYPTTRAYSTRVAGISRLGEHFVRFTFAGDELQHFGTGGLDQRIKLMLPRADGTLPELGLFADPAPTMMEWYGRWRALPDEERNPMRTYTVRDVRPEAREIDVDFVLHGTQGPASAWALRAGVGDELVILGPDERSETGGRGRSGGIEWDPGTARSVLLAGDETAVPAICAVLETLTEEFSGHVFLEVPSTEDILPVATPASVQLNWLPRGNRPHGEALTEAVQAWGGQHGDRLHPCRGCSCPWSDSTGTGDSAAGGTSAPGSEVAAEPEDAEDSATTLWEVPPHGPLGHWYAWLAGEAGTITGLRRHLVKDLGIDKKCVSFMGYWKQGRAEGS